MKNLNTIIVSFIFLFLLSLTFVSAVPTYFILKTNINASFIRNEGNGNLFIALQGNNSLQGINTSSNYVTLNPSTLSFSDYGFAFNGTHLSQLSNPLNAKNFVNYNGTLYLMIFNSYVPSTYKWDYISSSWKPTNNTNAGGMSACFTGANNPTGLMQGIQSAFYFNHRALFMGGTTFATYNYDLDTETYACVLDDASSWDNSVQGFFNSEVYTNNTRIYTDKRQIYNVLVPVGNPVSFGRKFFISNSSKIGIGNNPENKFLVRNLTNLPSTWAGTNLTPSSCTSINNLLDASITSVSCISETDCVFGGSYSYFGRTVPLLATYQNGVCGQVALPTNINDTVTDIDNVNGTYYFITNNKELGIVGAPYNVPQQATTIQPILYNVNAKLLNGLPYVYPVYANSDIIGYYNVLTQNIINYGAVTCDYTETPLLNDYFNYDVPSANGWLYSEPYSTQTFDVTFGRSLYLNSTNNVTSSIEKAFNPTFNDTKISFLIKPQSLKTPLDQSQDVYTSLRSTLNQDVVPLHFIYDGLANTMCVAGFVPLETNLMCFPYSNSYVNVEIYLKFIDDTFSIVVTDAEGNSYYSNTLPIYYTGANNIGKFYINPVSSQSDTYFDNLNITIVPSYPDITLKNLSHTTDIAGTTVSIFGIKLFTFGASYKQETVVTNDSVYSEQCTYLPNYCYVTRFYSQGTNQNAYNNYADFNVCATTNSAISETDVFLQANQGVDVNGKSTGLTQVQKYLVVLFSILVVFGAFVVVGFATDTIKMSTIMGMIVSVFGVIIYTVLGWIPAWLIVVIVVLALAIIIILPQFKQAPSG